MRLIDAENFKPHPKYTDAMNAAILAHMLRQPTIEAEPVVHCRDCKHCLINLKWNTALCMRTVFRQNVPLDGFCNFGERFKGGDSHE